MLRSIPLFGIEPRLPVSLVFGGCSGIAESDGNVCLLQVRVLQLVSIVVEVVGARVQQHLPSIASILPQVCTVQTAPFLAPNQPTEVAYVQHN
jgi:hypothetical protein